MKYNDADIAVILGTSRANIGQTIKRGLKKMVKGYINLGVVDTYTDAFRCLVEEIGFENDEDIKLLFEKLPEKTRSMIINENRNI